MTTRNGSRIYRGQSRPLQPGACPQCHRVVSISASGRRRSHADTDGRPCPGGRVFVGEPRHVELDELDDVVMPTQGNQWSGRASTSSLDTDRLCTCGWRPRRKANGEFEAHRTRPDDPTAPYCENGAKRCY